MPVFFIPDEHFVFPHPTLAEPDGLLGIGGDLSVDRLLLAYQFGIFPWFNPGEMLQWYFTNPRPVIFPHTLKISKSMRTYLNTNRFQITVNERFRDVMLGCSEVSRNGQEGSWIGEEMIEAYTNLHEEGYATSVEVYKDGELCGGFYGVQLGKVFFGESMFSLESNASKYGLIVYAREKLESGELKLIDCQQDTPHMRTLGSVMITGEEFLALLKKYTMV